MSNETLKDIQERFVYRDIAGIDGTDVTWLLNRIDKLEATIKRVNRCVRYQTTVEHKGELVKVPCLLLEHVQAALKEQSDAPNDRITNDLTRSQQSEEDS